MHRAVDRRRGFRPERCLVGSMRRWQPLLGGGKTRHQNIARETGHPNPASIANFRTQRPSGMREMSAISRHFERDPIPYALETDWPVGAAGFEPLHLRSEFAKTSLAGFEPLHLEICSGELHRGSTGWAVGRTPATFFESAAGAPVIRDTQVRVLAPS